MMHLAVSEEDIAKAESLVARVGKDYADSAMFAVAEGDSALVARLLREARDSAHIGLVLNAAWQVGEWLEQPAAAEPFARVGAARPQLPARLNAALAENLVSQGRWTAADSAFLRAVAASNTPLPRLERGITAALPFLQVPRPVLQAISADLSAWDPATDRSLAVAASAMRRASSRSLHIGFCRLTCHPWPSSSMTPSTWSGMGSSASTASSSMPDVTRSATDSNVVASSDL